MSPSKPKPNSHANSQSQPKLKPKPKPKPKLTAKHHGLTANVAASSKESSQPDVNGGRDLEEETEETEETEEAEEAEEDEEDEEDEEYNEEYEDEEYGQDDYEDSSSDDSEGNGEDDEDEDDGDASDSGSERGRSELYDHQVPKRYIGDENITIGKVDHIEDQADDTLWKVERRRNRGNRNSYSSGATDTTIDTRNNNVSTSDKPSKKEKKKKQKKGEKSMQDQTNSNSKAPPNGNNAPPKGGNAPPKGGNAPPKGGSKPPRNDRSARRKLMLEPPVPTETYRNRMCEGIREGKKSCPYGTVCAHAHKRSDVRTKGPLTKQQCMTYIMTVEKERSYYGFPLLPFSYWKSSTAAFAKFNESDMVRLAGKIAHIKQRRETVAGTSEPGEETAGKKGKKGAKKGPNSAKTGASPAQKGPKGKKTEGQEKTMSNPSKGAKKKNNNSNGINDVFQASDNLDQIGQTGEHGNDHNSEGESESGNETEHERGSENERGSEDENENENATKAQPVVEFMRQEQTSSNSQQEISGECPICYDNEVSHQFVPCGHSFCETCADRMRHNAVFNPAKGIPCPFCRIKMERIVSLDGRREVQNPSSAGNAWTAPQAFQLSLSPASDSNSNSNSTSVLPGGAGLGSTHGGTETSSSGRHQHIIGNATGNASSGRRTNPYHEDALPSSKTTSKSKSKTTSKAASKSKSQSKSQSKSKATSKAKSKSQSQSKSKAKSKTKSKTEKGKAKPNTSEQSVNSSDTKLAAAPGTLQHTSILDPDPGPGPGPSAMPIQNQHVDGAAVVSGHGKQSFRAEEDQEADAHSNPYRSSDAFLIRGINNLHLNAPSTTETSVNDQGYCESQFPEHQNMHVNELAPSLPSSQAENALSMEGFTRNYGISPPFAPHDTRAALPPGLLSESPQHGAQNQHSFEPFSSDASYSAHLGAGQGFQGTLGLPVASQSLQLPPLHFDPHGDAYAHAWFGTNMYQHWEAALPTENYNGTTLSPDAPFYPGSTYLNPYASTAFGQVDGANQSPYYDFSTYQVPSQHTQGPTQGLTQGLTQDPTQGPTQARQAVELPSDMPEAELLDDAHVMGAQEEAFPTAHRHPAASSSLPFVPQTGSGSDEGSGSGGGEGSFSGDPWTCTVCTYRNKPLHLQCDICGAERPPGS